MRSQSCCSGGDREEEKETRDSISVTLSLERVTGRRTEGPKAAGGRAGEAGEPEVQTERRKSAVPEASKVQMEDNPV